ncbi:MAG TPA: hypothetical protein VFR64_08770 [Methylomirabilota bacterium]|nr:hypothetical protein [Methylomirabilota bacterium]
MAFLAGAKSLQGLVDRGLGHPVVEDIAEGIEQNLIHDLCEKHHVVGADVWSAVPPACAAVEEDALSPRGRARAMKARQAADRAFTDGAGCETCQQVRGVGIAV